MAKEAAKLRDHLIHSLLRPLKADACCLIWQLAADVLVRHIFGTHRMAPRFREPGLVTRGGRFATRVSRAHAPPTPAPRTHAADYRKQGSPLLRRSTPISLSASTASSSA